MDFTEEMLRTAAQSVLGTLQLRYAEHAIDLSNRFERITIEQALQKYAPAYAGAIDPKTLALALALTGIKADPKSSLAVLKLQAFETIEDKLIHPTFIVDYPAEVSPLARRNDENREVTDRFELYIAGREIANGFSELNDPEDQATRFEEQAKAKGSTAWSCSSPTARAFATCCCFPTCVGKPEPFATAETLCYINHLARRALLQVSLTLCNRRPPWKLKPHVRPTLSSSSPRSRSRCSVSWESAPFLAGFRHRSETRARQARPWLKRPSSPWRSPSPPNEPKKNRPCTRGRNPSPDPKPRFRSRARRFRLLRLPRSWPR